MIDPKVRWPPLEYTRRADRCVQTLEVVHTIPLNTYGDVCDSIKVSATEDVVWVSETMGLLVAYNWAVRAYGGEHESTDMSFW